jgi:hypothetical protein
MNQSELALGRVVDVEERTLMSRSIYAEDLTHRFQEPPMKESRDQVVGRQTNDYIRSQIKKMALQQGWESTPEAPLGVPMNDPHFDFFGYVQAMMRKWGFKGLNLDEKTHETLQRLLLDLNEAYTKVTPGEGSVGWGPVFRNYPKYNRSIPFDAYFKHAVKNRGTSEVRDRALTRENMKTVNISPGGPEEGQSGQGISEETLGGGETDLGDRGQDSSSHEYMQHTFRGMLQYLRLQRHGDMLTLIFRLMAPPPQGEGLIQGEVAQWLNKEAIASPTGETRWSPGMVNSYVQKIRAAIKTYIQEEDKGEHGEGTLKKIYDRQINPPTPAQPTPAKSKGPSQVMWNPDGDPSKATPVTMVRKSLKNSRIKLPDGQSIVVPTKDLEF